jgi:hypothetical protein
VKEFGILAGEARHYEQNGRVEGTLFSEDRVTPIEGFGFRDHSWGVRDWVRAEKAVALFAQFGPELTLNGIWGTNAGQEVAIGYVSRDGANTTITGIRVDVAQEPTKTPRAIHAVVNLEDHSRLEFEVDVRASMPILIPQGKNLLHWYECTAKFHCGGEMGYGIAEVGMVV